MGKSISPETLEQIMMLRNQKVNYSEIARITGISRITVRNNILRETERINSGKMTREQRNEAMANDRLTMYRDEVANKYGMTERTVSTITSTSPLRDQFKRRPLTLPKKYNKNTKNIERISCMANDRLSMTLKQVAEKHGVSIRTVINLTRYHELKNKFKKSNTAPVKKPIKKEEKKPRTKRDKLESLETINVGHLKEKAVDKKLVNRIFDLKAQRHIYIPEKKMTISVSKQDTRSDSEIRESFLKKDIDALESCKIRDNGKPSRYTKTKYRGLNEVSLKRLF